MQYDLGRSLVDGLLCSESPADVAGDVIPVDVRMTIEAVPGSRPKTHVGNEVLEGLSGWESFRWDEKL